MVKILAASDLHGSYDIAKRLARKAKKNKVDLVLLAGDIYGREEGKGNILESFLSENQKVLFVPGNWDSYNEIEILKEKAKSIHNYYVKYGDVGIVGIGSPNMRFSLKGADLKEMKKQFDKMKAKKSILVSHLHPRGSKAEFSGVEGDVVLRKAVDMFKPDILISAHIHEAEGIEEIIGKTKIFQVGRKGKIFEI